MAARLTRPRVAVVGAGWAGLAAAVELVDAGAELTLFEAGRHPGGRARTALIDGLPLDNGQHLLIGAYRETLAMMRRVGVDPERVLRRQPLAVLAPPAFRLVLPRLPAPLHVLTGLVTARAPWREKLAAARFMRALAAARFRLPADGSVRELLDAHGQHGALRQYLWESLCLAALNTPPEHASAQVFAYVLRDSLAGHRAATDLLLPRAPLGDLFPDPALAYLRRRGARIHLGCRVKALTRDGARPALGSAAGTATFDHVILATAPQHLAALLPPETASAALRQTIGALQYQPIATLYAHYPAHVRLPHPVLQLTTPPGQWVFDRGQLGGPPGLIAHVLSAHGEWEACAPDALNRHLHAGLQAAVGELPPPQSHRLVTEHRATFACRPALDRVGANTPWPDVWLAGDHVAGDYPATLEGAIQSGRRTAEAVLGSE